MPLSAGTRLGAYEILGPLGAGGMGEVYRARDTRLGREVAVKVLPAALAADPDRLARLEREARAVAALNHPNIVVLHSIEEDGGVRFITMELVEGETLDEPIAAGGLPAPARPGARDALAEALAAAHERGVVHRDLKPANVMVTRDGRVKVLDFGLAKLRRPTGGALDQREPTLPGPISTAGQVVGTVPYMAPEQLRGEPVDARTDLFALGVVLYETGHRPAAVRGRDRGRRHLRDPARRAGAARARPRRRLPAELDRVIARCLEKDPRRRAGARGSSSRSCAPCSRAPASEDRPAAASSAVRSLAVLPLENVSHDPAQEYFADGMTEALISDLARLKAPARDLAHAAR